MPARLRILHRNLSGLVQLTLLVILLAIFEIGSNALRCQQKNNS
jgi:hypothetical protein